MKLPSRLGFTVLTAPLLLMTMAAHAVTSVDLNSYQLVARYALPEPTRTPPPPGSLLAQEASAVTWNRDTNTLFVVGDGSTSITQISLTGQLIDSMTLGKDPSKPQGTAYYDIEGLAYVGSGKFVLVEERLRTVSQFTYVPNTTLNYADSQHVKLGTTVGNIGLEGIAFDPQSGGFVAVKESGPSGVFQTTIDFAAGTASNGSAGTLNSLNLFDPSKAGLLDFADVFALSNIAGIGAADQGNLLFLSQESGKVVKTDRAGNVLGSLTIPLLPGVPGSTQLSVADQGHEGITMDGNGILYMVAENGGGSINNPELWVYAPVPEPGPLSLMLAGLGAMGFVVRRRRTKATR
jgi:uncharacterized protein YjiK